MNLLRINIDKLFFVLLLFSVILYFSQGVLIPSGGIGKVFLLLILSISFVYLVKTILLKNRLDSFLIIWFLFLLMNLFSFLFHPSPDSDILKGVFLNFLPFFAFHYFSRREILTPNVIVLVLIILLPVFIVIFNQSIENLKLERNREEVVDNTIYLFIGLLPFTFFFKRKVFSWIFLLVIWYFMVQSAKRGAIICGVIAMGLLMIQNVYASKSKIKIWQYIVLVFLFSIIAYYGYNFYLENQFLIERIESMIDGNSSGRDYLITKILHRWYQSNNIVTYLFGLGFSSSSQITGQASHNDWVEILASFGIFGLILYLLIYFALFLKIFDKNVSKDKKVIIVLVLLIAMVTSLTSRWYWSSFSFMQMLIIPYLLSYSLKRKDL